MGIKIGKNVDFCKEKSLPGEYTEPGYETRSARSLQGPLLTDARSNDLSRDFV